MVPTPPPTPEPVPSPAPPPTPTPTAPTPEPIPVGSHAIVGQLNLPIEVPFDSALLRDELALLLDVPVDRVRITANIESAANTRVVIVAITDLTAAQETEVSAFFDDNPTFTLDGFGTVTTFSSAEVAKQNVTIRIFDVCTSVSATDFPEAAYIAAFNNALASTASVTTSIPFGVVEDSPSCDDATPEGSTRVVTDIEVAAVDLGAVLALLPTASTTIDLDGDFGVVSLGNQLELSIQ